MKPAVKLAAVFCAMCIVDLLPAATAADTLSYDIKPKQKVAYRVKIVVSTPSATETMQGVIVYTGTTANEQVLTVEYNGGLKKSTKSKTTSRGPGGGRFGRRPGGPPIPRSPWDQPDFRGLVTSTNTLVITRDGTVESMRGDSQLPFLLGNLSLMPFEALPAKEQKEWKDGNGVTITSGNSSSSRFGPRFGPFANDNDETRKKGGGESSEYSVEKDDGKRVTISKNYSLTSPAAVKDETG